MSNLLTDSVKSELYMFFAVAFDAAPGVTYMGQLADAVNAGMSVKQIVEVFTTKPQFTSVYPNFFSSTQFADKLIETVVGSSADDAAKAEAKADVVAGLNSGMSRGEVIYTIFHNLSSAGLDSKYAGVAQQLANQVTVAQYFTEVQQADTTDLPTLRAVLSQVTEDSDVSSPAAIESIIRNEIDFNLSVDAPVAAEGDSGTKILTFTLTLDKVPVEAVTLNYETTPAGTATAGTDFNATAGTVTFAAGQKVATVSVVISGDTSFEADETVGLLVSGAKLVASVNATGTIANDDVDPQIALISAYDLAKAAYDAAATKAAASLAVAHAAAAAADTAEGQVDSLETAQAFQAAAAAEHTAANTAVADAVAAVAAAAALAAAAAATARTSDDGVAAAGGTAATAGRDAAQALLTAAAADVTTAAAAVTDYTAHSYVLTAGLDDLAGAHKGGAGDDLYIGAVSTNAQTTFSAGDMIDGGEASNTLRLFMDQGTVADGVQVSNVQTLELRLNASNSGGTTTVVMTDWDDSLQQIDIRSNKSSLSIEEQQVIADVSITDQSTIDRASSYGFNYAAGVLDGDADTLNLSLNNVNGGEDGANIGIDAGMEAVNFTVADRTGAQYASDINLSAAGVSDVTVEGGVADQAFTLDADIASGAHFDSTTFAGDMVLGSGDILTAELGAGNDRVTLSGQTDNADSSYDLGEGDNTLNVVYGLAGSVVAGSGSDAVVVDSGLSNTGSIDLGEGNNYVHIEGDVIGQITVGSGDDRVEVDNVDGAFIDLGDGNNIMDVNEDIEGDSTVTFGDGDNQLTLAGDYNDIDGNAQVIFGDGDNTVSVEKSVEQNADITFGAGDNTLLVGSDIGDNSANENNVITFGAGNNTLIVGGDVFSSGFSEGHATTITLGDGNNTAWVEGNGGILQGEEGTTSLTFGNGDNELLVGYARDQDDDLVLTGEDADVSGATVEFGNGTNFVQVADNVVDAHIHFGNGDDNQLHIGGNLTAAEPGTITFGDGDGNEMTVGGDIRGETVTFGAGADNSLVVDGDVVGASITFGDGGGNQLDVNGEHLGTPDGEYGLIYSTVTFGSGADTLNATGGVYTSQVSMGDGTDEVNLTADGASWGLGYQSTSDNQTTTLDLGAGDDHVTMISSGTASDAGYVYSGGFIEGGEGDDTLTFQAQSDSNLIMRELDQVVTLDLLQQDANSYTVGQEVTVTFTRGDETFSVTYTVVAGDIAQGDGAVTSFNVTCELLDALNGNADFDGYFTATQTAPTELTITSDDPLVDFDITSSAGTVTVEQISDTHIGGIENLELVALNGDAAQSTIISADFNLIDGVQNILLDSQEDVQEATVDGLLAGQYTTVTAGGVSTFELVDLHGGEAITVSGFEDSATGNRQVERITVGTGERDHQIGDKIVVTIGETEVTYTIDASDLTDGSDEAVDADLIATHLAADPAFVAAAAAAGFSVAVDGNQITLVGSSDENVDISVDHQRIDEHAPVFSGGPISPGTWDASSLVGFLQAGDEITLTIDGEDYVYTVTEEDCARGQAEAVTEGLAAVMKDVVDGVSAAWGRLTFGGESSAMLTVTREADVLSGGGEKTVLEPRLQSATASDDSTTDVVIDANVAGDNTKMNLTVKGEGDFDLAFGEDSGYTGLDLKLGDEFSHTIYTNGYLGSDNFASTITVSDVDGVDTAGQTVVFADVLAHDVTSTSAANLVIDQYSVRANEVKQIPADNYFDGEAIDVDTGTGDDHLITAAQSALNGGSHIDLGAGENRLSLGWGDGVTIGSADLEAVGGIDNTGDLARLDILSNVVLDVAGGGVTTLTMPGGVDNVATVGFNDVEASDDGEDAQNLTIVGAANDFRIETFNDLDLYSNQTIGTLTVQNAAGDEITGSLTVVTEDDEDGNVYFNLGNRSLTAVAIAADEEIELYIDGNTDGAEFNIGPVTLDSEDDEAQLLVSNNVDSSVNVQSLTVVSDEDSDLEVTDNAQTEVNIGDVNLQAYGDADVFIERNAGSSIELGQVHIESWDTDSDDASLTFLDNSDATLTVESLQIVADYDVLLDVSSNTDSEMTVTGDITLEAVSDSSADAYLDVYDNTRTNVSLAVDGTVTLESCEGDAGVTINNNLNDHQPAGNGPDLGADAYTDYTVELGNVVLDAGDDAYFEIDDNTDDTFFGDQIVKTGDVKMTAYNQANLTIGEDYYGPDLYDQGNHSTTVELGKVDMVAYYDVNVHIAGNTGYIYDLGNIYPVASRYQYDNSEISTGDLTLTSTNGDVRVDFDFNDLAGITVGDVNITADDWAQFSVDENVHTSFLSGDVSLSGDNGAYFSFYSDDTRDEYSADPDTDEQAVDSYTIDGDLTVAAGDVGGDSQIDIWYNDGEEGDSDTGRNLEITVTGNIEVTAASDSADASFEISDNDHIEVALQQTVSVESKDYAEFDVYSNSGTGITLGGGRSDADLSASDAAPTLSVTSTEGNAMVRVADSRNDSSIEVIGSTLIDGDGEAALHISDNDDSEVVFGAVELKSSDADAMVQISDNDSSHIELGDLTVTSGVDASISVIDNSDNSLVEIGNVDVTAASGIEFTVTGNHGTDWEDWYTEVDIATGSDEAITLSGDHVGSYGGDNGVYVEGGEDAEVHLGDFVITASDGELDGGNDVDVHLHTSNTDSFVSTGDITIDAENDVYFYAADHGDGARLSMGDITITAGHDSDLVASDDTVTDVSSKLFFSGDDFSGTESISLTAESANDGEGNVYVDLVDAHDLETLTVAGTNAEIYLDGQMGANSDGVFTLDLSGLNGTFGEGGSKNYDPLGDGSNDNVGQDSGSYVSTVDADFDTDDVVVKVGTGDLIYNAQHSSFDGGEDDFEYNGSNYSEDWNGNEGWFSLGDSLDLTPVKQVEELVFWSGDINDGDAGSFDLVVDGHNYQIDIGSTAAGSDDDGPFTGSGYLDANGNSQLDDGEITWAASGTFDNWAGSLIVTFTGAADGSAFDLTGITAVSGQFNATLVSNDITQPAQAAVDGDGNLASETFVFADDIGEVVIGGFRPNGFVAQSEVDRLDLSAFDGTDGKALIDSAADLIITIDDSDGYFADVVIDFVDQSLGSIRLVGVGEYFTNENVNGIANSITFAA